MVGEEVLREPGAQVVAPGIEERCRLLPDRVGRGAEHRVEHGADGCREVARVARVVDEDPVFGERERIAGRWSIERQAVVAGEHRGRADRQRIERLGLGRQLAGTRGEPDVEAAERDADGPGHELGGEGRGVGFCFRLGLVVVGVGAVLGVLGVGAAPAEALGDGAAVLLVDAVQGEAALVDLGLDLSELGLDRLRRARPRRAARAASVRPGIWRSAGRTNAWLVSVRVSRLRLSDQARRARAARAASSAGVRSGTGSAFSVPIMNSGWWYRPRHVLNR